MKSTKKVEMESRVRAGLTFLDSVYGLGWRKKIKLRRLDLSNPRSCPLGQTDSDYNSHRIKLGLSHGAAYALGFHIMPAWLPLDYPPSLWAPLTTIWKRILRRQGVR